jgi:hypothetical protein
VNLVGGIVKSPCMYVAHTAKVFRGDEVSELHRGDLLNDSIVFVGGLQLCELPPDSDDESLWGSISPAFKVFLRARDPVIIAWAPDATDVGSKSSEGQLFLLVRDMSVVCLFVCHSAWRLVVHLLPDPLPHIPRIAARRSAAEDPDRGAANDEEGEGHAKCVASGGPARAGRLFHGCPLHGRPRGTRARGTRLAVHRPEPLRSVAPCERGAAARTWLAYMARMLSVCLSGWG